MLKLCTEALDYSLESIKLHNFVPKAHSSHVPYALNLSVRRKWLRNMTRPSCDKSELIFIPKLFLVSIAQEIPTSGALGPVFNPSRVSMPM